MTDSLIQHNFERPMANQKSVYVLYRVDPIGREDLRSVAVLAESPKQARQLVAMSEDPGCGSVWRNPRASKCERVDVRGLARVLVRDFWLANEPRLPQADSTDPTDSAKAALGEPSRGKGDAQ